MKAAPKLLAIALALSASSLSCARGLDGPRLERPSADPDGERAATRLRELLERPRVATEPRARVSAAHDGWLSSASLDSDDPMRSAWRTQAVVDHGLHSLSGTVVYASESHFVALDAASGAPLWSRPRRSRRLEHAASDGRTIALTTRDVLRRRSFVTLYARGGARLAELQTSEVIRTPWVARGIALVPWGDAYLSAIDASDGEVLLDAALPESTPELKRSGDQLWLHGRWRYAPVWPGDAAFELRRRPLPDDAPSASPRSGAGQLLLDPRNGPADAAVYVSVHGRILIAWSRATSELVWVRAFGSPLLDAAAFASGFGACEADGTLHLLSPRDGSTERRVSLAAASPGAAPALAACSLSTGTLPAGIIPTRDGPPPELIAQLVDVTRLSDPDLRNVERFLYRELAARPEPEATRALIRLAMRASPDQQLSSEAGDLLATRRNGEQDMLATLRAPAPLSSPGELPPLGPLADALGAMGSAGAAPLLALHLNHPGYSASDRQRAARALSKLATEAELPQLELFFALHRITAREPGRAATVAEVASAISRVGGARAQKLLRHALRDPLTAPEVKAAIERSLSAPAPREPGPPQPQGRKVQSIGEDSREAGRFAPNL